MVAYLGPWARRYAGPKARLTHHSGHPAPEIPAHVQAKRSPGSKTARQAAMDLFAPLEPPQKAPAETIGAKVAHVRAAQQSRSHHCHWPGCPQQVPPAVWGCARHWYMLPINLRRRIWHAYVRGQEDAMNPSRDYLSVARETQEWIEQHGKHRG